MKKAAVLLGLLVLWSVTSIGVCNAQESVTKIQSLYLYNFAKYIEWPTMGDKIVIGIYAPNDVYEQLSAVLKPRKIGNRGFELKNLNSPSDAAGCHMVFIGQDYTGTFNKIVDAGTSNMLVVTERDLLDKGASISFILEDSKLKFKINTAACRKSGLQVSGSLVSLGA